MIQKKQTGILTSVLLILVNGLGSNALQAGTVTLLNSTLEHVRGEYIACPQQRVNFICTTTGANIQEWYSVEYITGIDDRIQLHEGRLSGTGQLANATIISITTDEVGEKVIVSRLTLIASTRFPVSTVSCGYNGQGMRDNITFRIQTVKFNTTLENVDDRYLAYPQQKVYFTCTTIGANIQEWYSPEYITGVDDRIQLHEGRRSGTGRAANATIIDVTTNEVEEKVIVSQLSLIASTQYPVSTVSCGSNGQGMRDNITFNITDSPSPTINSTLRPEGYACPGERIDITCVTLDSYNQTWTSDNYTGEEIHIQHTFPIGQRRNSTRFSSTSAVLVLILEVNGRLQLTSHLTITVSESATNQIHSVTCSNMMDASSISFLIEAEVCDVTKTPSLNITTEETVTVASSKENPNFAIGYYIGIPIGVFIILINLVVALNIIIINYVRQKSEGPHQSNSPTPSGTNGPPSPMLEGGQNGMNREDRNAAADIVDGQVLAEINRNE